MKKTRTVDTRTCNQAEKQAAEMVKILEQIQQLKEKAYNLKEEWEWTNYLQESSYKVDNETSLKFADDIRTIQEAYLPY